MAKHNKHREDEEPFRHHKTPDPVPDVPDPEPVPDSWRTVREPVEEGPAPVPAEAPRPVVTVVKKSDPPRKLGEGTLVGLELQDNENGSYTVFGTDEAGDRLDLSEVAKIDPAPTTTDDTYLTATLTPPLTVALKGKGTVVRGSLVDVRFAVVWEDGSSGPFMLAMPCDVENGVVALFPPVVL